MIAYEIKIPKKRIPILIGTEGKTKRKIEKQTETKLEINSETGLIIIKSEDSLKAYKTRIVIEAIGRGFNPNIALTLLSEKNCIQIIPIQDFTGKNKKKIIRIRARIIGTRGKCRKIIEHLTSTEISIYGKTVSIIGESERVALARKAIEDILSGAPHGPVYKNLEIQCKQLK